MRDVAGVREVSTMSEMPRARDPSVVVVGAMALMTHSSATDPVTSRKVSATKCVPARTAAGEMEASRTVSTPSATVPTATAFREREVISDAY